MKVWGDLLVLKIIPRSSENFHRLHRGGPLPRHDGDIDSSRERLFAAVVTGAMGGKPAQGARPKKPAELGFHPESAGRFRPSGRQDSNLRPMGARYDPFTENESKVAVPEMVAACDVQIIPASWVAATPGTVTGLPI